MEYPKAVKDEILSILRDQIENNREPGDSYAQITAKFGVSRKLIYGWKTDLKRKMASAGHDGGFTSHQIFQMVLQASSLNELELGGFLRSKGITKEQLAQWSAVCEGANAQKVVTSKQPDREARKKIKKLEAEPRRKERALAETAAILVLRGKAEAIWGENEVD